MRVERGVSQILFGMLPNQTVDLNGRVWRVVRWTDPVPRALDQESVRRALLYSISPWAQNGTDDGLERDLRSGTPVEVVELNVDRGVLVEPFPRQWRCKNCGRISTSPTGQCSCGSEARAQMHFVAYHECGALQEPRLPRCPTHRSVAVALPGTASARDVRFFCPDCNATLSQGFPYQRCLCGSAMSVTVHRAAIVFSPHYAVLVNPPDPALALRFRAGGGGVRALEWVLDGMVTKTPDTEVQTFAGLMDVLQRGGLSKETAEELARIAADRGAVRRVEAEEGLTLPESVRDAAQEEALSLAYAATGGRTRLADLAAQTPPPLRALYERAYPQAIHEAGLCNVELLPDFPVATLAFGYTRGETSPGTARLVPFRDRVSLRVYGSINGTEALLFQLDPVAVLRYLERRGFRLGDHTDPRAARLAILQAMTVPRPGEASPQQLGKEVLTLIHSYAHRVIRRLSAFAGIERESLSEYLLPHHLSLIVYAAARGDFVLGGLQTVFETCLHKFLEDLVYGEARCPLDPGCRSGGGACMACLHLGEPSCRWFNQFLNRNALFGTVGFIRSNL